MRTMFQLIGGVAVAGAVAAGSTAFTAAGLTNTSGPLTLGGHAAVAVTGAKIVSITSTTNANANEITAINVKLTKTDGTTIITAGTVTMAVTGDTGTATDTSTCTDANTDGTWICPAASGYWSAFTDLDFDVVL